jgi:hypothetical protein
MEESESTSPLGKRGREVLLLPGEEGERERGARVDAPSNGPPIETTTLLVRYPPPPVTDNKSILSNLNFVFPPLTTKFLNSNVSSNTTIILLPRTGGGGKLSSLSL